MLYNMNLMISVDASDERPLYRQIAAQVREAALKGELQPGESLPSVRDLAASLGINLHTVRHAYTTLRDEGVVRMRLGFSARVGDSFRPAGDLDDARAKLKTRLRDWAVEALQAGWTKSDIEELLQQTLQNLQGGKT